jgi:hypothetical protein
MWLLRDFTLQLHIDGRDVTPDEYLDIALAPLEVSAQHCNFSYRPRPTYASARTDHDSPYGSAVHSQEGEPEDLDSKNRMRASIKESFPNKYGHHICRFCGFFFSPRFFFSFFCLCADDTSLYSEPALP